MIERGRCIVKQEKVKIPNSIVGENSNNNCNSILKSNSNSQSFHTISIDSDSEIESGDELDKNEKSSVEYSKRKCQKCYALPSTDFIDLDKIETDEKRSCKTINQTTSSLIETVTIKPNFGIEQST